MHHLVTHQSSLGRKYWKSMLVVVFIPLRMAIFAMEIGECHFDIAARVILLYTLEIFIIFPRKIGYIGN